MSDELVKDLAGRVKALEADVGTIKVDMATVKERLTHMPTTAALWKAVAISSVSIIGAMWLLIQFLAKPWLEQLIQQVK